MTLQEQLDWDLGFYGVCYEYEIDGKVYRLDPRYVRKTEAKPNGEIDAKVMKDIMDKINGNVSGSILPPVQYKLKPL